MPGGLFTALIVLCASPGCGTSPAGSNDEDAINTLASSGGESTEGPSCASNSECAPGELCQGGACTPNLPGGPCEDSSNCVDDETCENGTCVPEQGTDDGMGCGGEVYTATAIPPNVLIVQDRSGSMDQKVGDEGTKWMLAKAAIEQVVTDYADEVFFGLMLYPGLDPDCDDGKSCGPGVIAVDVGPATATAITSALNDADTCSLGTPTAETLEVLQDYSGLADLGRPNYVLLITDGQSSCDDPVPMVAELLEQDPPIKTFVVGFGDGVDVAELNEMAEAGGTALMGDQMYYQAGNAQSLVDAFADIAGSVLSCSFVLDVVPPDPDKLFVFINDVEILRDLGHDDGWDYEAESNQVTFYGPPCELMQSGQIMDLQFVFGCPEPR
ncbi:VWA domain-containing protein [Enhygromyxa salina]|uniref:VWA domain-containing protein n=1 Tax=Enhygromyxa salina TaxID=215803 RepID=UPI0015E6B993|nr:VWA domain-containing protein [Enhygromyxa salina]